MVDNIVVVVDGEISEIGSYEELLSYDRAFAQFLRTYVLQEDSDDDDDDECLYCYLPSFYVPKTTTMQCVVEAVYTRTTTCILLQ